MIFNKYLYVAASTLQEISDFVKEHRLPRALVKPVLSVEAVRGIEKDSAVVVLGSATGSLYGELQNRFILNELVRLIIKRYE